MKKLLVLTLMTISAPLLAKPIVPIEFHGLWAKNAKVCHDDDGKGRLFISETLYEGYEFHCKLLYATKSNKRLFNGGFMCDEVDGQHALQSHVFERKRDTLRVDGGVTMKHCDPINPRILTPAQINF